MYSWKQFYWRGKKYVAHQRFYSTIHNDDSCPQTAVNLWHNVFCHSPVFSLSYLCGLPCTHLCITLWTVHVDLLHGCLPVCKSFYFYEVQSARRSQLVAITFECFFPCFKKVKVILIQSFQVSEKCEGHEDAVNFSCQQPITDMVASGLARHSWPGTLQNGPSLANGAGIAIVH